VELKDRLDSGETILVVDSRSSAEYRRAHIAGAVSVPLRETAVRIDEFPRDQDIVFY
jgi:rhodanese-related sulfurtransferase